MSSYGGRAEALAQAGRRACAPKHQAVRRRELTLNELRSDSQVLGSAWPQALMIDISQRIASELGVRLPQVEAAVALLDVKALPFPSSPATGKK